MLRRQFYYALAVHERGRQLARITHSAATERERLLRAARRGAFACASYLVPHLLMPH